ncbi:MAG: hypothetical protein ACYC0H_01690 [Solirubrobacteraceae bacterium]
MPASLKQLEKAVAKANAEHDQAIRRIRETATNDSTTASAATPDADTTGEHTEETLDGEPCEREDLGEDVPVYELGRAGGVPVDVAGAIGPDGGVYSDADTGL